MHRRPSRAFSILFRWENQPQIRQQLSLALLAVVAQQLVPSAANGGRYPVVEILMATSGVRSLIRKGDDHQIYSAISTGTQRRHGVDGAIAGRDGANRPHQPRNGYGALLPPGRPGALSAGLISAYTSIMRRRSFLLAAAAAVFPVRKSFGQTSLGTLMWVQPDGLWIRELPDGPAKKSHRVAAFTRRAFHPPAHGSHIRKPTAGFSFFAPTAAAARLCKATSACGSRGEIWWRLRAAAGCAVFGPSNDWKSALDVWKDAGLPVSAPMESSS